MIKIRGPKVRLSHDWPEILRQLDDKRIYTLTVKRWYQKRTTGKYSQNHHIYGHAVQIGTCVGNTKFEIIMIAMERAITKDYPTKILYTGKIVPMPESEIDSRTAGILIDELHMMAAELDIKLIEEDE